jgi:hypothetical protein
MRNRYEIGSQDTSSWTDKVKGIYEGIMRHKYTAAAAVAFAIMLGDYIISPEH